MLDWSAAGTTAKEDAAPGRLDSLPGSLALGVPHILMFSIDPVKGAAPLPDAPRRPRWLRRALQTLGWSAAALCSLLLLAWLILHWGILNHIERWRGQIEHRASQVLGVTVLIGDIKVRSGGWVPAVDLRDVVLLDAGGEEALRLPRVSASLAPSSLLALEVRLEQLVLDGAALEVRRDTSGRIYIGGVQLGAVDASSGGFADWFFEQHEFVVRNGSLRWIDEQRAVPALTLTGLDLVFRHGLASHEVRLDATPPGEWGERFSLQGQFTRPLFAAGADWRRWSGTVSANLPRADLRELRRHLDLPFELTEGEGALRGWLVLDEGTPRELTLDLALRTVRLRLASHLPPLALEQVEGRLIARRDDDGVRLAAERFGFVTGDSLRWPRSDFKLAWQQRQHAATPQPVTGGELSAEQLDLALLSNVAERLPLGDSLRRLLADLDGAGLVSGLAAQWSGSFEAPSQYRAQARINGLSLAARAAAERGAIGRPGLARADVDLKLTEAGGAATLALTKGAIELPGVFEEALLPIDRLAAQLAWKVTPAKRAGAEPDIELNIRDARFANADLQGSLNAVWRTGSGAGFARGGRFPGYIELDGNIAHGLAARTARYLPLGLSEGVRRYVANAVQAGTLGPTQLHVKGDIWDFPFHGRQGGEFRVAAKVENAVYAYVPSTPATLREPAYRSPWPALTQVSVELLFDRGAMRVRNGQGRLQGIQLTEVRGGIENLLERPLVALEGSGVGLLADALRFVNQTPVGDWTKQTLREASADGSGDLRLELSLPLVDLAASRVKGSLLLAGNDVRLRPGTPLLAGAHGRIDFSERGFAIAGASARVAGGEASFEGGSQADGTLRFSGQGVASAQGLRASGELELLSRVAQSLSGQTDYRMTLGFVRGQPEIMVTSNLVGLAADLPPPLGKAAQTRLPMLYQTSPVAQAVVAPGAAMRDTLRFELGSLVQAFFLRDLSGETTRVLSGGIGVNQAAPISSTAVAANLDLEVLDIDAWSALGDQLTGGPARASGVGVGASNVSASHTDAGYLPSLIALRVDTLRASSRRLTQVVAGVTRDSGGWRANVVADQLNGHIEYRAPRGPGASALGLVHARLARLALPKGEAEGVEHLLDEQPASVPALDIVIDDFELRGKRLGRVEIEASNRASTEPGEPGREWRLSRLALIAPEATLAASGRWAATPGASADGARSRAAMNFTLELADSGAFLDRLGFVESIRGGKGRLAGKVAWLGSPLSPDLGSMTGEVNLALDAGQFLKVEPGVARFLGVLSLQSLPRRLALDFRDVFEEGFAFDNVTGDVKIAGGVASTNNLRMRGVQAAVLMEGTADIARETQELRVVVVPRINAGTASLAYAVINPVVGIGTFLAQVFLRDPIMQAATREFRVTGSWADPNVERVQRQLGDGAILNFDAQAPAEKAPSQ